MLSHVPLAAFSVQGCPCNLAKVGHQRIISFNTPAMPLPEAHFGGFFVPEICP